MAAPTPRARGLRELPLERLLFITALGCSVLLLSVVMLRSEQAAGVTSAAPRTFRDGFIVAQQHDVRRTESTNGTALVVGAAKGDGEKNDLVATTTTKAAGLGTQVRVEQQGEHTMTKIQTEDGDEITIKRAAHSNKITTISAHEDGKITIENRKTSGGRGGGAERESDASTSPAVVDTTTTTTTIKKKITTTTETDDDVNDDHDTATTSPRRVGTYEKIAPGKKIVPALGVDADDDDDDDDAAAAAAAAALLLPVDEPARRTEAADKDTKKNKTKKKVTLVEIGRTLTKVSVQDEPAAARGQPEDADAVDEEPWR